MTTTPPTAVDPTTAFPLAQRDSYCRTCSAVVLSCVPSTHTGVATPKATAQQKKSTASSKPSNNNNKMFDIILSDTVLFAEGGGQPGDVGMVDGHECRQVVVSNGAQCIHVLDVELPVGKTVEVCFTDEQWAARFDRMQQHTAQHILSAVARSTEGGGFPTVAWALYPDRTIIEIEVPSSSTVDMDAVARKIEKMANNVLRTGAAVKIEVFEDFSKLPDHIRSRGNIPTTGAIRTVQIQGDVDFATCCGTHVRNVSDIQMLKVLGVERMRAAAGGEVGTTRVAFVAGNRVLQMLGGSIERDKAISKTLNGFPVEEFPQRVASLVDEVTSLTKAKKRLTSALASVDARTLASTATTPAKIIEFHRAGSLDMSYLDAVAEELVPHVPETTLVVLTDAEELSGDGKGCFLLAGPPEDVAKACALAKEVLVGKGGGKGRKVQGKCEHMEHLQQFHIKLHEVIH